MRTLVAVVVGVLGVMLLLAGVNGSGKELFLSLFGKGSTAGSQEAQAWSKALKDPRLPSNQQSGRIAAGATAGVAGGTRTTVAGGALGVSR